MQKWRSVEVITSFTIVPSLKRRGMQGTSAVSGRTSSTRPLIRLGGARRRCSNWRRSAGNTKRDTGRSSLKSWGWAGGSTVYLSEMCVYFWSLSLSPLPPSLPDWKNSFHVSSDVPAFCLGIIKTWQLDSSWRWFAERAGGQDEDRELHPIHTE